MPDTPLIETVEQRMLQDRLDAAREGATRARAAHIVITIASLALFVALWNAYLSWYGQFEHATKYPPTDATQKIQEEVIAHWVSTQWVSVGPLGIQVGASDLGVWGGVGLAVISIWFFLAVRRENHIVGRLISDVWKQPPQVQQYVFHGIISRQIFTSVSGEDTPIGEEMPAPPLHAGNLPGEASEQKKRSQSRIQQLSHILVRAGVRALIYLPPLTVICIFAADLISLWLKAEYRGQVVPLWQTLGGREKMQAVAMLLFSFISAVGLTVVSHEIKRFRSATTLTMQKFWDHIEKSEKSNKK